MQQRHVLAQAEDAAAHADGTDHMTLCWTPDGGIAFYPETTEPERLARRLLELVKALVKYPAAIPHAAGACEGHLRQHMEDDLAEPEELV